MVSDNVNLSIKLLGTIKINMPISDLHTFFISYLKIDTTCDNPPIIPNTLKLSNGLSNGSMTLYTCTSGFASNGENPTIFCNGTHWSISQYYCSGNTCIFS